MQKTKIKGSLVIKKGKKPVNFVSILLCKIRRLRMFTLRNKLSYTNDHPFVRVEKYS